MTKKLIAATFAVFALMSIGSASSAWASNGADDPVQQCQSHCDDGPGHH